MEDSQKGASKKDLKKNPPPDDDFGKDFFNSWESEKFGNDSLDFDMETVPKNKMASFKFDELDNFELSGNFDKLSSFKLDVPDLDFPELSNKNEEARGKCFKECAKGKKESKEDKFSFDFDLNGFQIKPSSAPHQTMIGVKSTAGSSFQKLSNAAIIDLKVSSAGCNTTSVKEISKPKLDSSRRLGSQIININKDASLGGKSICDILNSTIAKTIEVNNNNAYHSKPRETKSVHFLEKNMACLFNAVNPANCEKHVSLHSPLKRRIDEESVADLETSSPLKCVKDSTAIQRSSFEASENTKRKMVPEFKSTETCKSTETLKDVTPVANPTSLTAATEIHNVVAGVPSVLEDEDKLLKTETFIKGLDSICCMLRKQHEKVKDLHVHSIINNSEMLLLNYSVLGENIQELQKLTSCLLRES